MNRIFYGFLIAATILVTGASNGFAEQFGPPAPVAPATDIVADEAPFQEEGISLEAEGLGLYHSVADGGLGKNLWEDSSRSDLIALLERLPVKSRYTAIQHMIFGVLMTSGETAAIHNDIEPQPGRDLLSIRLRKLIDAGAYQQAAEIYTLIPDEARSESIVRSGIYTMLFTGEKSLACVELKTVIDRYGALDFFKVLSAYCDVTLADAPSESSLEVLKSSPHTMLVTLSGDKNFMLDYAPDLFDRLSFLERAMIVAEGRLKAASQRATSFRNVPPAHVQLLMKAVDITEEDKFILSLRAVEWGLMKVEALGKNYSASLDPDIRRDPELSVPVDISDWKRLPYLLQLAKNKTTDEEKWAFIQQAFPIGKKYGLAALTPFGGILSQISIKDMNLDEVVTVLSILVRSELQISQQFVDFIEKYQFNEGQKDLEYKLLGIALMAQPGSPGATALRERALAALPPQPDLSTLFLKNVIENIDKSGPPDHNAVKVYENKNNLTSTVDYVMQSMDEWNHFIDVSRKGPVGETVLLSAQALTEASPEKINPDYFQDTLQGLKFVGLTDISRNMAMEVILGSIKF